MKWMDQQLIWIMVSLAISLILAMFLPFYISLPLSVAIFIGIVYFMRKRVLAPLSTGSFGGDIGGVGINYVCISCGHRFKGGAFPRCGSKMLRADF